MRVQRGSFTLRALVAEDQMCSVQLHDQKIGLPNEGAREFPESVRRGKLRRNRNDDETVVAARRTGVLA